ncbi:MAG: cytochrome c [Alphaproteobacteria bacterium]|nr:cytochrome c [Alphaproteobacteria bacterium]
MLSRKLTAALVALTSAGLVAGAAWAGPGVKYGSPISEADVAALDIDIRTTDGAGLPPGKGSVAEGAKIFAEQCLDCHGEKAAGGSVFGPMVGGVGSFLTDKRKLTPGSMYPYAPILFDYMKRAMPMTAPQSLSDNEVYALSAYILNLNGLVKDDAVMDAKSLAAVEMPNKNGFLVDSRPDTKADRCMSDCKPIKE